jgi:hypothetical protein
VGVGAGVEVRVGAGVAVISSKVAELIDWVGKTDGKEIVREVKKSWFGGISL